MKKLLALILTLACCIPFVVSCHETEDESSSSSIQSQISSNKSSSSSKGSSSSESSFSSSSSSSSESLSSSSSSSSSESSSSSGSSSSSESSSSSSSSSSSESSSSSSSSSSSESSSSSSSSSSSESSSSSSSSSSNSSSSVVFGETYLITYYVRNKDYSLSPVFVDFWVTGGNYPTSYTSGIGATIDVLKPKIVHPGGTYYVEFLGWYLDKKCTIPFDGTIDPEQTGDVVLYAKTRNESFPSSEDSSGWVDEK